jgi:4-amino-4-deoxy-L-arabinose transferase-like glycosyltransferase
MWAERHNWLILLFLLILPFALRLVAFFSTVDIPGDGPARAIIAYEWSRSPHISTHGIWIPGFMYLAGIFTFLVDNPLFSSRILNLIIGTMTVPVFYLLVHRLYGHTIALFSALILAFFPLHIGLSVSSLTEASLLFEVIVAMIFLIRASENPRSQNLCLGLALLFLCLAMMTRYEAWLLIPLFTFYYYWKTRKPSIAILMMLVLLTFPVAWMLGNYFHSGDLPFLHAQLKQAPRAMGTHPVDSFAAIRIIGRKSVSHLGWILLLAGILGAILQIVQAIRGRINAECTLYLLMLFVFTGFMFSFAMLRGKSLLDRYLLFGFVMALPIALSSFVHYLINYQRWLGLLTCIALISVGLSNFSNRPEIYVTREQPAEIKKVADWLKNSPYRNDAILATKMGWQSSYLPLYLRRSGFRYFIVSPWSRDSDLRDFLQEEEPSLLITRNGEDEFKSRIEALIRTRIERNRLVHKVGTIEIISLNSGRTHAAN